MNPGPTWWETLMPWLDSVRTTSGERVWTGWAPADGGIDMECEEGPIVVRSISGGEGPHFRRTLAACAEYVMDLSLVSDLLTRTVEWSVEAALLRPVRPSSFPRAGAALPLESRWAVEWRTDTGPLVRTSGESGRGMVARRRRGERRGSQVWSLSMAGAQVFFTACHEPAERPRVKSTSTLVEDGRFTARVTGEGYFDYWMLDPTHSPAPLRTDEGPVEVGSGWGFVRLEHGRETTYGALRKDWGRH